MRHLAVAALAALALLPGTAGAATRAGVGRVSLEAVFVVGYDAKAKATVVATYGAYTTTATSVSAAGPKTTEFAYRVVCLAYATAKAKDSGCAFLDPGPSIVTGPVLPESGRIRVRVPTVLRGWLQADLTVTANGAPFVPPLNLATSKTTVPIAGVDVLVGASVSAGPLLHRPGSVTGTLRTSRGQTLRPVALTTSWFPTSLVRSEVFTAGGFADRRDVTAALHEATLNALG